MMNSTSIHTLVVALRGRPIELSYRWDYHRKFAKRLGQEWGEQPEWIWSWPS